MRDPHPSPFIAVAATGPTVTITLDRPHRHNSLVPEMLEQLEEAFGLIPESARAVVLRAAGASFSTGGDVAGFAGASDLVAYGERIVGALNRVMLTMMRLTQPVVAAVNGMVTGGSLGLVLAADVVLVSSQASFTPWYREVGFAPDGGWTAILPHLIGHHRTIDVLATDRTISAAEAVAWGLASRLVPASAIDDEAQSVARLISTGVEGSIRHSKQHLRAGLEAISIALEEERRRFIEQLATPEVAAGMARFLGR